MIRSYLFTAALVTFTLTGPQLEAQYPYQTPGPNQIVASWYRHFMGREPDAAGLQGFVFQIQRGMSYDEALANFLGSDEYYQRQESNDSAFIVAMYRDLLGRYPNSEELRIQLDQLYGSGVRVAYVRNFLTATQYDRANRVVPPTPRQEWQYRPLP